MLIRMSPRCQTVLPTLPALHLGRAVTYDDENNSCCCCCFGRSQENKSFSLREADNSNLTHSCCCCCCSCSSSYRYIQEPITAPIGDQCPLSPIQTHCWQRLSFGERQRQRQLLLQSTKAKGQILEKVRFDPFVPSSPPFSLLHFPRGAIVICAAAVNSQ